MSHVPLPDANSRSSKLRPLPTWSCCFPLLHLACLCWLLIISLQYSCTISHLCCDSVLLCILYNLDFLLCTVILYYALTQKIILHHALYILYFGSCFFRLSCLCFDFLTQIILFLLNLNQIAWLLCKTLAKKEQSGVSLFLLYKCRIYNPTYMASATMLCYSLYMWLSSTYAIGQWSGSLQLSDMAPKGDGKVTI